MGCKGLNQTNKQTDETSSEKMANSVNPDQTAFAVWSWFTLFTQVYLTRIMSVKG